MLYMRKWSFMYYSSILVKRTIESLERNCWNDYVREDVERVMLQAIRAMYTCTKNILRSAIKDATVGVRQGSPSSCLLFMIYIDHIVRMLKRMIVTDGILGSFHILWLMDDAVMLAASRQICLRKLDVVNEFCTESGMVVNKKKNVINGN